MNNERHGEDSFDMLVMLDREFDLRKSYPGIEKVEYKDILSTPMSFLNAAR